MVVGGCRWFWVFLGSFRSFNVLVLTSYESSRKHANIALKSTMTEQ